MTTGSTLPRRALGRQLRKLRNKAGLTQAAASRVAEVSAQSYGRMEDGRPTRIMDLGINALADAYSAADEERRLLLDLAQEIRRSSASGGGWWRAYDDAIAKGFDHYLSLEEAANWVTSWQATIVPGLLQNREYRRSITWAMHPEKSPEEVDRMLDVAVRRQDLLDRPDFRFEALITEAVLHYTVGSSAVMSDQIRHMLERSESAGVEIRVVPNSETNPVGLMAHSFVLFSFPVLPTSRLREPPVAYMEGLAGGLYMERDTEVARFSLEAQWVRDVALPGSASRDLMLRISKEWSR